MKKHPVMVSLVASSLVLSVVQVSTLWIQKFDTTIVALFSAFPLFLVFGALIQKTRDHSEDSVKHLGRWTGVVISFATVTVLLLAAKYVGNLHPVPSISRLLISEDNAKWINVVGQLAQRGSLDAMDLRGVGPAIVILLQYSLWIVRATTSNSNVVTEADAVVLAHTLLVAFAAISTYSFLRRLLAGSKNWIEISVVSLLAGSIIAGFMQNGFLSLELVTCSTLALGLNVQAFQDRSVKQYSVLIWSTTALSWLPLIPLAICATVGLLFQLIVKNKPGKSEDNGSVKFLENAPKILCALIGLFALLPTAFYIVHPSKKIDFSYLLTAEGGTSTVSQIVIFSVLLMLFYLITTNSKTDSLTVLALILLFYVSLVGVADVLISSSAPHYGTNKLILFSFSIAFLLLVANVFVSISDMNNVEKRKRMFLALAIFSIVASTEVSNGISQFGPKYWKISGVKSTPWMTAQNTRGQNLLIPVVCFVANEGGALTGHEDVVKGYSCTRFTTAISGYDRELSRFQAFFLGRSTLEEIRAEIEKSLDRSELQKLGAIILNSNEEVIEIVPLMSAPPYRTSL